MPLESQTEIQLLAENADLRARLGQAEEALRAIRSGEVDALVVDGPSGPQVFTLQGLDAESNRFRGEILAQVSDAVVALDEAQRVSYINGAAEKQYGVVAGDILGCRLAEIYENRWLGPNDEALAESALHEQGEWRGESVHVMRDGRELRVESTVTVLRDEAGQTTGTLRVIRDITTRKQIEAQLLHSESMFREMIDALPAAIYTTDAEGCITHFNPAAVEFSGRVPEIGTDHWCVTWKLYHPDGTPMQHSDCPMAISLKEGRSVRGAEAIAERPDGTRRWFEPYPTPLRDANRKIIGGINMLVDITARKLAEQALQAEVAERKQAEEQVRELNTDLERRVAVRVAELAEKARVLAEQNIELEQARRALEEKAAELALTSKYKSQFLANMSHELRTPLNSILILSQQLAGNTGGNLTTRQVEFSHNINSSGIDLLNLINDILDLAKIESGTVTVEVEEIDFADLRQNIERSFRHVAEAKNLPLEIMFDDDLPRTMISEPQRLHQIIKNLLSNAVKFTSRGEVKIHARRATRGWTPEHPTLSRANHVVAFSVKDTGIGVALEKQRLIFEAFQQADVGTSRKFGGTGLGLAISRELAALLGGEIQLESVPGQGSTFTLYLPLHSSSGSARIAPVARAAEVRKIRPVVVQPAPAAEAHIKDDRNIINEGDATLLIIEDDLHYASILLALARARGYKGVVTSKGVVGLALAKQFRPAAISLDVFLPDMLGWTVLNQLKLDPATRHIPVQVISVEDDRQRGLANGAFSHIIKSPTSNGVGAALDRIVRFTAPRTKRLLIVAGDTSQRELIEELLGHNDIETVAVGTRDEALQAMLEQTFDCVVLDLRQPDLDGLELLPKMHADSELAKVPVVVFTPKALAAEDRARLRAAAKGMILKDVQSLEQLLDETSMFLHRVVTGLPAEKQSMLERLRGSRERLRHNKVLVVDDDARNIFALTSFLENQDMDVMSATSGRSAIDLVRNTPDLGVVLMDIMMPDMDGYETTREIRKIPDFRALPIIAVTANAMKGDREKCIDAGASDYIAKPVNTDLLLSLMCVWLFR